MLLPVASPPRRTALTGLCAILASLAAHAAGPPDDGVLTLARAADAAVANQPLLEVQHAGARAAREAAVASRQLPDPRLTTGVRDLPVDTGDRFSLRRDSDTQVMIGLSQEFPRAEKRRLRGERGEREAELAEQEAVATRLMIRRDAALAWLDAWEAERSAALARVAVDQADAQAQAVDIAYRAGRSTQADVLAAGIELERMHDAVADFEQQAAHARSTLSRWIGPIALEPLPDGLPHWEELPPLEALLTRLRSHPHLDTAVKQIDVAQADVDLARAAYLPDWRAEIDYGYRPEYSEMVTLQLGIDLPFFTAQRQDRELAARVAEKDRAEQLHADLLRQHEADARLNYTDWTLLQSRLQRYDQAILPQADQRIEAARLAWQSGQGTLAALLVARRESLDDQMKRVDLQADAARHRINLQYFFGEQP